MTTAPQTHSLLHDTLYRRSRRAIVDRAHNLDDALTGRRRARRRILFEAASPLSFAIFRPVYEQLRTDPRLEFWFTACGSNWTPETIFRPMGLGAQVVSASKAAWMKVNLYINTDFWDATWQRRRARRVHLFHGVAGKYGLDAPVELAPTVASFDCLMFPNEDRLSSYVAAGLVAPTRAALTGYPKTDCLVDGSIDGGSVRERLGFASGVPVVMYAPTWSPQSSLHTMGEAVIAALERAGFQVIVKLHDRSYDPTPRGGGGVDWAVRLARWEHHPRVRIVRDADASPYLCASDALITCHSSVGFEFMLLDRPLVVLAVDELVNGAQINPRKVDLMRSAAEVARRADQVPSLVERQLAQPTLHSAQRRTIARELFYQAGTATTRAVRAMYELLELEVPAPVSLSPASVTAAQSWSVLS